ncbi:Calcium permeable stress-gated cation channel 1, partial [Globisporangium splendens]
MATTASPTTTLAEEGATRSPSEVLLTTAIVYLPLFVLAWLLFEVLRRRKPMLFEPVNPFNFSAADRSRWFAWIPFVYSISDTDIFEKCGLDAWVFLRFIRIGQKVALLCVVSSFALFPIYAWKPLTLVVPEKAAQAQVLEGAETLAEGFESLAEQVVLHVDWVERITLSNVGPGDWRLLFTVLSAYAVTFYVMHLLIVEYTTYRKRRHAFLSKNAAQQYTIVVSDLPHALRRPQTLMAYMDYLFPSTVYSVYIGVECRRLEELVEQRTQLQYHLEAAESDLQDAEAKSKTSLEEGKAGSNVQALRPHHKTDYRFLGICCGRDVDSIDYYRDEIEKLTQEIVKQRKTILDQQFDPIKESKPQYGTMGNSPKWSSLRNLEQKLASTLRSSTSVLNDETSPLLKPSIQGNPGASDSKNSSDARVMRSYAFVSFRSLRSAQAAQQLLQTENPIKMRVQPAPHIDDVLWENFGLPLASKSTWVLISTIATLLIVLFWTIPTAFVTSLAKPENLRRMSSFVGHLLDTQPWLQQVLEQSTPLILSLMNSLSNVVFKMLATREGHLSVTEVDASLFSKLNSFQVFQMFFVSTVTGSILAQVAAVVEQPSRLIFFLGSSIAGQSLLFITFIITQICVNLPLMLLRVTPIVIGTLHHILAPTYAKKPVPQPWMYLNPLNYESELEAPFSLAQQYLIFLLVVVFTPIAPLVGYAGGLYFLASELIYKRFFFFVNQPKWNTQNSMGAFWPPLFMFALGAMLMAQITLIGLLSLKPAGYGVIILSAGLPCCTFLFYWYSITLFNLSHAAEYLPLDQCCDLDDERKDQQFTFLDGVYQQPAMAKAYSDPGGPVVVPSDANAHIDSTGGSVVSQPSSSAAAPPLDTTIHHENSLAALNAADDKKA